MKHEDWFDENGYFIGYIPRVIWRQVANDMRYNDILDCVNAMKFTVNTDMAIDYIRYRSAWKQDELRSWSNDQLSVEIFIGVCNAIADFETFKLLDNN